MKLALKSIVSTMLAAAVLTVSSVTAFAVDYAEDPDYVDPDKDVVADGETDNGKTADKPVDAVDAGYIEAAEGDAVTVYITDSGVLTAEAVAKIVETGKTVTLVGSNYTVTVDPAKIFATEAANINLAMAVTVADKEVKIVPATDNGDFGMEVVVTLSADVIKGITNPVLYYVADDGSKTDVTSSMTVTDKDVQIKISHASYYVIEEAADKVPGETESSVDESTDDGSKVAPDDDNKDPNSDVPPGTGVTLVVVPAALAGAALVATGIIAKKKSK